MSALTISQSSVNQGFLANPSVRLNRRGRLARTLVVLSLAIVVASVAGGEAGANTSAGDSNQAATSARFITVTVAPGDTLWSLAGQLSDSGSTQALVSEIIEINSLSSADVSTGQEIRIPLNS
jgi:LysM repeat protein